MRKGAAILCTLPRLELAAPLARAAPPGPVRQVWADHDRRPIATGGQNDDRWWMHWPGLATFWFRGAGEVYAEPEREGREAEIRDVFVRGVTPVVLLARGFEGLHASSVRTEAGVVPLVGTSGTGKSTIALAVASAGLSQFADDTVVYRMVDGWPIAVRLPFPVRVDEPARAALGVAAANAVHDTLTAAPFQRIYHLVRDSSIAPSRPVFAAVPATRRFELLLAHAHPFEMGHDERRRAFLENLMTVAAAVDVWECRFAPDLATLRALAASIRQHLDAS